jgi:hypothetical protein
LSEYTLFSSPLTGAPDSASSSATSRLKKFHCIFLPIVIIILVNLVNGDGENCDIAEEEGTEKVENFQ